MKKKQVEWFIYMIRCRDRSLYTGISNDVARRFGEHQEMGNQCAKYLRGRGPLKLVFQKKIGSKSEALKMEKLIKKLSKARKERIIEKGDFAEHTMDKQALQSGKDYCKKNLQK